MLIIGGVVAWTMMVLVVLALGKAASESSDTWASEERFQLRGSQDRPPARSLVTH